MRRADTLLKTMTAVQSCLSECLREAFPLDALQRYVDRLRRDPQWQDAELQEVETTARRAILSRQRLSATHSRN
jgi:hypothetical protein